MQTLALCPCRCNKFFKMIGQTQHSCHKDRIRSYPHITELLITLKEAYHVYNTTHCHGKKKHKAFMITHTHILTIFFL